METKPPPIIDSAKLVCFASNDDDVTYTDRIELHVGVPDNEFERIGELPNLAIANPYNNPTDFLLMLCNEDWNAKGVIAFTTINEAKLKAERGYAGITSKWQENPYSPEQVDDFLRDEYEVDPKSNWWSMICAFCGKKDSELGPVLEGKYASICKDCVADFYEEFNNPKWGPAQQ